MGITKRLLALFMSLSLVMSWAVIFPQNVFAEEVQIINAGSTSLNDVTIITTGTSDLMNLNLQGITYKYNTKYSELDTYLQIGFEQLNNQVDISYYMIGARLTCSDDGVTYTDGNFKGVSEINPMLSTHDLGGRPVYESTDFYNYYCYEVGYGYALTEDGSGLSSEITFNNFVSLFKVIITGDEIKRHFDVVEASEYTASISYVGSEMSFLTGTTGALTAKLFENGAETLNYSNYKWESLNTDIATIERSYKVTDGNGNTTMYSAVNAIKPGNSVIRCTFTLDNGKTVTTDYTITVSDSKTVPLFFNSAEVCGGTAEIDFNYTDNLFAGDANNYNYELSKFSSIMAASAYKQVDAETSLRNIGFTNIDDCGSYDKIAKITKTDNDYVAYTFATKDIYVNGQKNTVVAVVIKGTSKNPEWYSNFNVGEDNGDVGDYHRGFKLAADRLCADLNNYILNHGLKRNGIKIWITGHSRGAGIGNIIAGELTSEGKYSSSNIYAYLYAPPAVMVQDSCSEYRNIYNFINPQDFVPRMPLQKWNFKRYGQDYIYPNEISHFNYDKTISYLSEYQMIMSAYFMRLFNKDVTKYLMHYGTASTINVCNDLYDIAKSVDKYYNGGMPGYSPYKYFYEGVATASSGDPMTGGVLMLGYVADSNVFNIPEWININQYFIAGSQFNKTVWYSHCPEMYIAWAYTCDSLSDFDYNLYVKGILACPVDVEVYDSHNNLVGRVVNNQVDESVTVLSILVDEETSTKTIYMPATEEFTIKAIGYDYGTMDYSIELCDITDLSTSDIRTVEDIPITPDTVVSTVTDLTDDVVITAASEDKTIEYVVDKNNNVEVEVENNGTTDNRPTINPTPVIKPTPVIDVNKDDKEDDEEIYEDVSSASGTEVSDTTIDSNSNYMFILFVPVLAGVVIIRRKITK